jgi:kinesin family protein 23
MWLDHRPANAVELGTVMQPLMKRRKSVTKLTDAKDVANSKTSKYCLMTQEQDSGGELETCLYKVRCLHLSVYLIHPYKA